MKRKGIIIVLLIITALCTTVAVWYFDRYVPDFERFFVIPVIYFFMFFVCVVGIYDAIKSKKIKNIMYTFLGITSMVTITSMITAFSEVNEFSKDVLSLIGTVSLLAFFVVSMIAIYLEREEKRNIVEILNEEGTQRNYCGECGCHCTCNGDCDGDVRKCTAEHAKACKHCCHCFMAPLSRRWRQEDEERKKDNS